MMGLIKKNLGKVLRMFGLNCKLLGVVENFNSDSKYVWNQIVKELNVFYENGYKAKISHLSMIVYWWVLIERKVRILGGGVNLLKVCKL